MTWGCSVYTFKGNPGSGKALSHIKLQDFQETEPALAAQNLSIKSSVITLDAKQFISVRDYLIVRLTLENGQRPGPMETATVRDFRCPEKGEKGSVMFVTWHKTSRGGPAPISMTDKLYSKIHTYVKNIRPHIAQKDEDNPFVMQAGVAFPDGTIGKRVVEWWQKAKGRRINSTQIRKMAASTLHEANPVEKRKVHKHMCHSEATADQYYMMGERTRQALESHTIRRKLWRQCHGTTSRRSGTAPGPQWRKQRGGELWTTGLTPEQLDHVDLLFSSEIHSNAKVSIAHSEEDNDREHGALWPRLGPKDRQKSLRPHLLLAKEQL